MILFHGSEFKIEKPYLGGGKASNDYGSGFYCTESEDLACEWAVTQKHDGYANRYSLELDGLRVLDLNAKDRSVLHWLTVLLQNRAFDTRYGIATLAKPYLIEHFSIDLSGYDVIRGSRADDSYFSFAQDFLSGVISYPQLTDAMRLGKLGEQIVLKSAAAFGRLKFESAVRATRETWLAAKENRDKAARRDYFDMRKTPYRIEDLSIQRILQEGVMPGDPRL